MKGTMRIATVAAAGLALAACDDEETTTPTGTSQTGTATGTGAGTGTGSGGGPHEDLDEEACEHLADGPFADVTAADSTSGAPDVSAMHTAHRITLVDVAHAGGGGAGGGGGVAPRHLLAPASGPHRDASPLAPLTHSPEPARVFEALS